MKKTLYFEGAGCVPCNDVENCRIRTAFTNKEGKKIYIEFLSGYKHTKKEMERLFLNLIIYLVIHATISQMIRKLMIATSQD